MHNTVRTANEQDLDELAFLFDSYRQFYELTPDAELARQFIKDRFTKNDSVILVAVDERFSCSGFCQMYPTYCSLVAKPIYTMYDIFVHPDARERGIGRQLLVAAQNRSVADGMDRMDLTTAKNNVKAQSLYSSEGWVRDDVFYTYSWYPRDLKT
jgi:ribosomal protein S18 acetylase RimI-like enzyme